VAECTPWATVQRAAWEALKKAKSETSGRRGWKHSPTSATGTAWERTPGLRVWLGVRAMGDAWRSRRWPASTCVAELRRVSITTSAAFLWWLSASSRCVRRQLFSVPEEDSEPSDHNGLNIESLRKNANESHRTTF